MCRCPYTIVLTMNDLRVLIIADDPLTRAGLAALLANQTGCIVVGQIGGEGDVSAQLEVFRPDVVVWDIGWDPTLSIERLADLSDASVPILALLPDAVHALETWSSGSSGLLLRDAGVTTLLSALSSLAQGIVVFDPELADAVISTRDLELAPLPVELTPRELEVLRLMSEGLANKDIAYRLDISEHTVKFHVNSILGKLGARSRTEAVINATRMGLVLL